MCDVIEIQDNATDTTYAVKDDVDTVKSFLDKIFVWSAFDPMPEEWEEGNHNLSDRLIALDERDRVVNDVLAHGTHCGGFSDVLDLDWQGGDYEGKLPACGYAREINS